MRRRGYHQREHQRTREGTTFKAGQGGLVLLQRPSMKMRRPQAAWIQSQGPNVPRSVVILGRMIMEAKYGEGLRDWMQAIDDVRTKRELRFEEETFAGTLSRDQEYVSKSLSDKKKHLIGLIETYWLDQSLESEEWIEKLEELYGHIHGIAKKNRSDSWDIYAINRGKVLRDYLSGSDRGNPYMMDRIARYPYYNFQVFRLGKAGLALKYIYDLQDRQEVEWFYLLPHAGGVR